VKKPTREADGVLLSLAVLRGHHEQGVLDIIIGQGLQDLLHLS
jgi:hypothetical protein